MAGLEKCPTCGNETSENATTCPACGEPLADGWAETVRAEQRAKADAEKKAKSKKRLIILALIAAVIVLPQMFGTSESEKIQALKEQDPQAYQQRIDDLEARVAKVPASDAAENLRLYKELQKLDPENARYSEKVALYEGKVREAEAAAEVAAKAEEKRKGFHCLSAWDGSHPGVKRYVEERMRDPDSFEHIETRISPVNNGEHTLIMSYRARNGFGGMTVGKAVATIQNNGCSATVMSID